MTCQHPALKIGPRGLSEHICTDCGKTFAWDAFVAWLERAVSAA
jgi:hypothetical protein